MGESRSPEQFDHLPESAAHRWRFTGVTAAAVASVLFVGWYGIIRPALTEGEAEYREEQQRERLRGLVPPSDVPRGGAGGSVEDLRVRGVLGADLGKADAVAPDLGRDPDGAYRWGLWEFRGTPQRKTAPAPQTKEEKAPEAEEKPEQGPEQ